MSFLPRLSVRFRLSAAIAVLFGLIMLVSTIGILVLNRTELWMNVLHKETLAEVSDALDLSRETADLATSAPFLYALFPPFQLEQEKTKVLQNLSRIEALSAGDAALGLPVARLRLAIDDLTNALAPQTARQAELASIDREMERLNQRTRRLASDSALPLAEREVWAALQQLTASAIGAGRANALIELGELSQRYSKQRDAALRSVTPMHEDTLAEIEAATQRSESLFVLKHRSLAARLDAENALFRIRQEARRVSSFAEAKVAEAEARLSQARSETSSSLEVAKKVFLALTAASLLVAISSSLYVSRYVARNLHLIAAAMRRLAAGNHRTELPVGPGSEDEIGQLYAAFRVFRESARKLELRTRQIGHQNALFSRVFRNIKDGVAIATAGGWIEAENETLRKLLRLPAATPGQKANMADLIKRSSFVRQTSASERGGFEEYIDSAGNVLELRRSPLPNGEEVWLISETTERKRVEQRLEEIRRVEALGKVSGEVAHDFGNILSSISGNLHLLEEAGAESSKDLRGRIQSALDLGVSLTERLLAFARKQHLEPQVTDVGQLIEGMADLLEIGMPESVTMSFEVPETPVFARVDPGQLESAVLNLCLNAGQAIGGSGCIHVRVSGEDEARLSVRDNGSGMTPEVLRRATEPFYSNREDGSGTGLGLSMVDGFVHQSGGSLKIQSQTQPPDQGTTVTLSFPALSREPGQSGEMTVPGTALVVDDDPVYLTSTSEALQRLGFTVVQASGFKEGGAQLQQQPKLDLVISDLNLDSGESGWELLHLACRLHPECRLVLISTRETYRTPAFFDHAAPPAKLTKPFTEESLRQLIASS
ncbi:putative hybrid two-component system regulatory protein [Roseobacter sp. SK209-2-6]|uniref:ATP-binding protein n=1 Tax=Roseobacter sp. SK209-2-6 TaxID=388739 RepID=UPI0000F3EE45|nr:ATP-binding protein [Roseobacter sp. SK209-2-6]EBA15620.1 putative hybrid two-component system regulatory protein [Roseobacter sp. SK209-2-6]